MNGYPKNHDVSERQHRHDEIDQHIAEWRKTGNEIEVIPFGAVTHPQGYKLGGYVDTKVLWRDFDDED